MRCGCDSDARLASTSALVSGRPRPVPPGARAGRELAEGLERGLDLLLATCRCRCRACGAPLRRYPSSAVETITWPPASVNLIALDRRLRTIWRSERSSATTRRQPADKRRADDDALAVGLRLHQRQRIAATSSLSVDAGEVRSSLPGLDLGKVEQVVDQADHMLAGGMDVAGDIRGSARCRSGRSAPPSSLRRSR